MQSSQVRIRNSFARQKICRTSLVISATNLIIINRSAEAQKQKSTNLREKIEIDQHNSRVDDSKMTKTICSFVNIDEIRNIDRKNENHNINK